MALVIGSTGSGKSIASMLLAAKVVRHFPTSKLWILDFKGDTETFGFLKGVEGARIWQFTDCLAGLENYYTEFQNRLANDPGCSAPILYLWCDEWASFVLNLDKKDAEKAKSMLSTILMMGRSKHCFVLTTAQRASADLFNQGARDNYSICLALGNISKESASMLGFDRDSFVPVTSIGGGHLLINGTYQRPVQVPVISHHGIVEMKRDIRQGVTR